MNFRKTVILIISIAAVLAGCDFTWQRYSDQKNGFSIAFPWGWRKEKGFHSTAIMASAPLSQQSPDFAANANVMVTNLPQPADLSTYFELNKEETFRVLPGDEYNVTEGDIYAGLARGKVLSFNANAPKVVLKITSAVWIKGNRVFVVTCSSSEAESAKYEPIFRKIMRSLRMR